MGFLGGFAHGVASELDSTNQEDTGKRRHGRLYKYLHKNKKKTSAASDSGGPGTNPGSGTMPSMKRGGKVKRTGPVFVHKGEIVLNKRQAKRYKRKRG